MQVPSDDEMGKIFFDVQPDAEDAAEAKAAGAAEDTEDAKTVQLARKRKEVLESLKDKLVEIQSTDSEPEQAEPSSSSACLLNTELERNVRHKKEKLSQEPVRVADAMAAADAEAEVNLRCKKETFSLCFAFRLQALGLRGFEAVAGARGQSAGQEGDIYSLRFAFGLQALGLQGFEAVL
jgi:hypothetical protein